MGEVFSFCSGLYFRGKLAYARRFARPPECAAATVVITPSDGLRAADDLISVTDLERYAAVPIVASDPRYRGPLARDIQQVLGCLDRDCAVVLLGSIATTKYTEILAPAFGERLHFPREFLGRGDMSRGALLLRAVDAGCELDYARVAEMKSPPRAVIR